MSEKSLTCAVMPIGLITTILMATNVVVLELGRKGLWPTSGVGFSPWYPIVFGIIHLLVWPIKIFVDRFIDRLCVWWCILAEVVLMSFFLYYNYNSLKMIMYVS